MQRNNMNKQSINLKVFIRVRPLLSLERMKEEIVSTNVEQSIVIVKDSNSNSMIQTKFDSVFDKATLQV